MKALYIGILTPGTTSRMRADALAELLPGAEWTRVDTDQDFRRAARPLRSLAFRLKTGPLVAAVNRRVTASAAGRDYDLAWVDKGVYLWPATVAELRRRTARFAHFTPDTAFHANRSRHFFASAGHYDLLVTTKSFELDRYHSLAGASRVMLVSQAYDADLHRPADGSANRRSVAAFIGLHEPDRERCLEKLLAAGVPVRLGGRGWKRFVRRHASNSAFHFVGEDVFGAAYAAEYASARIGLGLLSRRFPERHTTRTFEIPACGALLATERTADTLDFFGEEEALFFDDYDELAVRARTLLDHPGKADEMALKGHQRVIADRRDNASVLTSVLGRLDLHQ